MPKVSIRKKNLQMLQSAMDYLLETHSEVYPHACDLTKVDPETETLDYVTRSRKHRDTSVTRSNPIG
jgi:hypothetical protein